jgi:hypothetical protein
VDQDSQFKELSKRLGVVIALLVKTLPKGHDGLSLRDQVELLSELGVRPKDIAEILGRTQTYVGKELARIRKSRAKGKKHE